MSDGPLTAAIGLENMVVVVNREVVLVAAKEQAQAVRRIVERLNHAGRGETQLHSRVYRPWGSYESLDVGPSFQIKHLQVKPGARLSLQRHRQRAEHWVVVDGSARVRLGERRFALEKNQSAYIPAGEAHALENPGPGDLSIIEVQSGDYLGEDDIERLADDYGRGDGKDDGGDNGEGKK